ncbi:MAG TPA: response regulator [Stenotrophomonas sp.]|nr:response regulator [Stenotrophomonas sp.]
MDGRVLVVEDESMLAMLIEDQLVDMGYRVMPPVSTVHAALAVLEEGGIGLAVLDVNLGGPLSFPVADALLARGIPFLFLTGYGRAGVPAEYQTVPVLQKPFRRKDLQTALAALGSESISANISLLGSL